MSTITEEVQYPQHTRKLRERVNAARVDASAVGSVTVSLQNACDRGDAAEIFAALKRLEEAARTACESVEAVIGYAISEHGYY